MSFEKENFLRTKLIRYLQQLDPSTPPRWGKMNVQQMIEHCTEHAFKLANGRVRITEIITPPGNLQKLRDFLMSDRPFNPNVKNPLIGEDPLPLNHKTVQGAIGALQQEIIYFFEVFDNNPSLITRNPFFGDLDFELNVQLLYKHSLHHLRQFGVEPLNL